MDKGAPQGINKSTTRKRKQVAVAGSRQGAGGSGGSGGTGGTATATAAAAASTPLPFWHGMMWDPLPFAEMTNWDSDQMSNLNEIIREQREKLRQLPLKYLPLLHGLRNNIDRMVRERLDKPHHRVFRVHWTKLSQTIGERIEELVVNKDLAAFEDNIQPFILAHAAQSTVEPQPSREHVWLTKIKTLTPTTVDLVKTTKLQEDLVRSMLSRLWIRSHAGSNSRTQRQDICMTCEVPLTKSSKEQMLVCPSCGFSIAFLDSTEAARTYGDEVEFTVTTSHRYNHWQEFVTRSQAREVKAVPRNALAKIARHLKSLGLTVADVTPIIQIHARLTGKWPRQMTAEQMFVAKGMFFEILNAFEALFPEEKWFRNKYCTSVICCTMGWEDMIDVFIVQDNVVGSAAGLREAAGTGLLREAAAPDGTTANALKPNEQAESEKRMRAIFQHLGWVYRGPFATM